MRRVPIIVVGVCALGFVMQGLFYSAVNGVWPSFYAEMFPTRVRVSGLALGTQIGFAISGGVTPFLATAVAGAEAVLAELGRAPTTRRGLRPEGRAPIREGVELYADAEGGAPIGRVTSGGFGPSLGAPVAMASLPADLPEGATVFAELRGRRIPATLVPMPFVSPTYKR